MNTRVLYELTMLYSAGKRNMLAFAFYRVAVNSLRPSK